jgi:hypothetical protein
LITSENGNSARDELQSELFADHGARPACADETAAVAREPLAKERPQGKEKVEGKLSFRSAPCWQARINPVHDCHAATD